MMRVGNIVFWLLILSIIGIALWLAFGSPVFETSLIFIVIFVAVSEILLWKFLFFIDNKNHKRFSNLDKKTSLGFERVMSDFRLVNNKLGNIENNIKEIRDNLLGKK